MEKRYVVITYLTEKDTGIEHRYCDIMNDSQYDHFKRNKGLLYSTYTITDNGTFERNSAEIYEKIIVTVLPAENVIIHNEFYV